MGRALTAASAISSNLFRPRAREARGVGDGRTVLRGVPRHHGRACYPRGRGAWRDRADWDWDLVGKLNPDLAPHPPHRAAGGWCNRAAQRWRPVAHYCSARVALVLGWYHAVLESWCSARSPQPRGGVSTCSGSSVATRLLHSNPIAACSDSTRVW